jgi:bidirectional [NiFe] hydrogenase diaphorase subunit
MKPEDLDVMAEAARKQDGQYVHHIHVCMESGCMSSQSDVVLAQLKEQIEKQGCAQSVQVKPVGCLGLCCNGPLVKADERLYQNVQGNDASAIVASLEGQPLTSRLCDTSQPFFSRQKLIVRENSGRIDPENIADCIGHGAYKSLLKVLTEMSPQQVVAEISDSGLRGRGGAGFPTGLKWATVAKASGSKKYVICNGDEGDPGAFMDRSMMEGDPHRVLEGMAIAAYAVGAEHGVIYVRAEYPLAVKRLTKAINQARRQELIGHEIFGTKFNFNIEVRLGAGAFVCGEETALIASVEGNRGLPRPRPPYPANKGLHGCPTLINNVETFCNIPTIIARGSSWFASIGTEKSKGTKVFALTGKIKNSGLIEVPMGITLREIIFEIGGGIPNGKTFKALQTGGPSGGCIPASHLDLPVDYESLMQLGSIMGSGGMIVMDETSNMVDVARFFMEFCMTESCGKCVPCRVGTFEMHELLNRICEGVGTDDDLALLLELCEMVKQTSLCGLGQSAPNPVLSTLRFFKNEYQALIETARQGRNHEEQTANEKHIALEVLP